jgi:multisubunit Na+/H+ antiporter MnhC subunit
MSDSMTSRSERPKLWGLLKSIPDLVTRLIRDEIQAARQELTAKLKAAALGAGLVVTGVVFGLFTIGVLIAAAILGLTAVFPPWLSALTIGIALLIITVILILVGVGKLKKGVPPVPKESLESVKKDVRAVKGTRA